MRKRELPTLNILLSFVSKSHFPILQKFKWKDDGLLMNKGRVRNPGNVSGRWGDGGNPEISDSETSGLFLHIIIIADHMPCFQ